MQQLGRVWRKKGLRVGLVPTMGYLHDGHLSLVRRARKLVGRQGKVVVSVYVNPEQFGPHEDLSKYPRDLNRDSRLCSKAGVDFLFTPQDRDMYPRHSGEEFSTFVVEERLSRPMEGESRPGHFRGVTTVVAKLLNIVQPTVAVFGAKDYQQAMIVKRMVRDLNFPVKIEVGPIQRELDGLAMSSRNRYLEKEQRQQALVLWHSIKKVRSMLRTSPGSIRAATLKSAVRNVVRRAPKARLDYIAFFDPRTLKPAARVSKGTHVALAVFIGKTRLIDNARL